MYSCMEKEKPVSPQWCSGQESHLTFTSFFLSSPELFSPCSEVSNPLTINLDNSLTSLPATQFVLSLYVWSWIVGGIARSLRPDDLFSFPDLTIIMRKHFANEPDQTTWLSKACEPAIDVKVGEIFYAKSGGFKVICQKVKKPCDLFWVI